MCKGKTHWDRVFCFASLLKRSETLNKVHMQLVSKNIWIQHILILLITLKQNHWFLINFMYHEKYTAKDDPLLSSWTQSWSFHFDFSCFSIKTNSCRIMNKTSLSLPISQCSPQGRNVICTGLSHRNWLPLTVI